MKTLFHTKSLMYSALVTILLFCFRLLRRHRAPRSFTGPTGPKKEHKIRVLSHRGVYRDTTMLAYALGSSVDTFSIPPSLDIRKLGYNLFALDEEPPIALKKLGLPYTLTHLGPYAFSRQAALSGKWTRRKTSASFCRVRAMMWRIDAGIRYSMAYCLK